MRQLLSFLTIFSFGLQSISPVLAMPDSLESLERNVSASLLLEHASSLPSASVFYSDPEKTAAGILPYAQHNGKTKVLLARRNVEGEGWCNFGGKSDFKDRTLAVTAVREAAEESLGVYDFEPRLLRDFYSHDLYTSMGPISLYRMYFAPVQYVPADTFMEKLNTATDSHHKEYTHFAWIDLADLRDVIVGHKQFGEVLQETYRASTPPQPGAVDAKEENEGPSEVQQSVSDPQPELNFASEKLFVPLQWMLESKSVQERITLLLEEKRGHAPIAQSPIFPWLSQTMLSKTMLPQPHTISQVGVERTSKPIHIKWKEADSAEEARIQAEQSANFMTPGSRTRLIMQGDVVRDEQIVEFNPVREKERVVEALVNRVLVNGEVKKWSAEIKKHRNIEENQSIVDRGVGTAMAGEASASSSSAFASSAPASEHKYTASEAHLKIALEDQYVEGHTRDIYKENFKRLVAKYGMKEELRREVALTEEALDRLAEIFEAEHQICFNPKLKGMPFHYTTFNHGLAEDMMVLYQSFSAWDSVLSMKPHERFSVLRGTNAYMNLYPEINDAIEQFYEEHRKLYMELYERYQDPDLIEKTDVYQECMRTAHGKLHEIMVSTLPTKEEEPNNGAVWLWVNAAIAAGKATTNTSSSSIEYFLNSHSVNMPASTQRFLEATALMGMKASYGPYQSLFEQFIKTLSPKGEDNGGFLQVAVRSDQLDAFARTVHGGGRAYGHPMDIPMEERKPYVSRLLNLLHHAAELESKGEVHKISSSLVSMMVNNALYPDLPPYGYSEMVNGHYVPPFQNGTYEKKHLISEICILQHRALMQNERPHAWKDLEGSTPEEIEALEAYTSRYDNPEFPRSFINGYYRHPMAPDQQFLFDQQLQRTAWAQTVEWLLQDTFPLEGSFYQDPPIKKFYRMVHEGIAGTIPSEKPYTQALPYLMELGNRAAVESFLNAHPHALEAINFHDQFLLLSARKKWEMAYYLYKKMSSEVPLTEVFSEQEIKSIVRSISESSVFTRKISYLLKKKVDFNTFSLELKQHWLRTALESFEDNQKVVKFLVDIGGRPSSAYRRRILSFSWDSMQIKRLLRGGYSVNQQNAEGETMLEELVKMSSNASDPNYHIWLNNVLYLMKEGAAWEGETGISAFFKVAKHLSMDNGQEEYIKEHFPALATYRNQDGLTFLQYQQLAFLNGEGPYINSSLRTWLIPSGMTYEEASHPDFLKYFPHEYSAPRESPWQSAAAKTWQQRFEEILESDDFVAMKDHLESCTDSKLLNVNKRRITKINPVKVFEAINKAAGTKKAEFSVRHSCNMEELKTALVISDTKQKIAAVEKVIGNLELPLSQDIRDIQQLHDFSRAYPTTYYKLQQKEEQLWQPLPE